LCIYHLSTEQKKCLCVCESRLFRGNRWQLRILAALFKTIRVRACDIQSHKRGNKALVGITASQFVGNIKLSLQSLQHSWREFTEKSILIYPSRAIAYMNG
jgi:hypothetical protein